MAVDIYIRGNGDPYYRDDIIELNDELSMLMMQLEMVLFTNNFEVYGEPALGVRLRDLIHSMNLNEGEIKTVLNSQIIKYVALSDKFNIDIDVRFSRGELSDTAVVDIIVDGRKALGAYVS